MASPDCIWRAPRAPRGLSCGRWGWVVLAAGWALWAGRAGAAEGTVEAAANAYLSQVKPVLSQRCTPCHGALQQKAGLRLDTVDAMKRGGKSGPAVLPGRSADSPIWRRAAETEIDHRMPPEHEGEPLTASQLDALREWIEGGALGPSDETPEPDPREHWAFRSPVRAPLPAATMGHGAERNAVDAFLEDRRRQAGVEAQPEAPRALLLRRLHLDLIGLPPSPADLAAAETDSAPDWYERTVDRLLADPRHGERWARHWMDVWRYSDPYGLGEQLRNSQPHLWHWRDWIVESLNADLPYDEMIRLMLAADETHPEDLGRLRATGYLARHYFLFNRNQWMDEVVEHTGKAFLGLTLNCAKCHDHKYDPIPQTDYYRFRAFFEPYHARVEMVPGTADLTVDGIPRAYDREPDAPTYRFVRGQENQPDRSTPMAPGVPELLAFAPLHLQPVELPATTAHPEYREWVLEAHLSRARERKAAASREVAREAALLGRPVPQGPPGSDELPALESERGLHLARLRHAAAAADLLAIQRHAEALRARRDQTPAIAERHREAVHAERQAAIHRARVALAIAQGTLAQAKDADRAARERAVGEAQSSLVAAQTAAGREPAENDPLPSLAGAAWTPTRFADSTKDDPSLPFPSHSTGRRRALAEWITDRRHPLTARVAVNHVWNRHFGAPLAPNLFDFGRKSPRPLHAELLDWLAVEFMEHGWSLKHLHRTLLLSAAYRMDSSQRGAETAQRLDPDNQLWWRRHGIRLEAQVIRDSVLSLAGTLDARQGGPPVAPSAQEDTGRRSLYFLHSNNERNPFLAAFDDASVKECYRREQSIVPQQSLALLNSRLTAEAAPRIARRIHLDSLGPQASPEAEETAFVEGAFTRLLGFPPDAQEREAVARALRAWESQSPRREAGAARVEARSQLVWTLLNHHDFVTLR